jgi:lysyl endopeptidase
VPAAGAGRVGLRLESVSHGYRNALGMADVPVRQGVAAGTPPPPVTLAGAFDCQRDVNCSEGAPYQDVKRAAAEGYDGTYICSGQLVNNVRQDNRYLYLTAEHCEWWIDPPTMVYYWNYENSGCGTNDAPLTFSTGSTDLVHSAALDVDLLELDGPDLEGSYDIYFMGWNRGPAAPPSGATLSFPNDKPKQIAIENDPITDCSPGGCSGGFGPNFWRVEGWDVGVTEGGSSGAALLDPDQRLVGVLTGGVGTNCNNFDWDEFAKLGPAWAGLEPFLDPDATGSVSLPGKDRADALPAVPLAPAWGRALLVGLLLAAAWRARRPMATPGRGAP